MKIVSFSTLSAFAALTLSVMSVVAYGDPDVPSQFTSTMTPTSASVDPGAVSTLTCSLTDTGAPVSAANVDIEVSDVAGNKVGQKIAANQSWNANETKKYSYDWMTPSTPGTYKVTLVVTTADWSKQFLALYPAATITVKGDVVHPKIPFTSTTTASPPNVATGATTTVSSCLTDTGDALNNASVVIQINDPSGKQVIQKVFPNQHWDAKGTSKVSFQWTAPANAGIYSITLLVVDPSWTDQYYALWPATRIAVTNP